jgi:alkylation response protein AidB-like acyl-CoA dehydrogenase
MSDSHLAAAKKLRGLFDENAEKFPDEPVRPESIQALVAAGLFGVMTPKEVGGAELPINDVIDIFAEVSRADASTGWCLMAGASAVGYFGAFAEQSFVDGFFADGIPLVAGQFAPNGTGVPEAGGHRITGDYRFGSGIHYAEWVGAGFLVHPEAGSDAPVEYRFGVVPKSEIQLKYNWDVMGLGNTASYDYEMRDCFSPPGSSFLFAAPVRLRGGRIFELGVIALTAVGHAGWAIGVGRRALDELRAIAKTKVRMGAGSFLKDSERFLHELGTLESRLRSASAWVHESFRDLESEVEETGKVDVEKNNVVRQATVHVTQEAADIVRGAYLLAGTTGLRAGALQRCFRDIHAGSQHFFASPASTQEFARDLMNATPDSALDAD